MLKRNIISNFLGNGYVVLLQFALVPFLLKYLGAEAYGLVGIYTTLLAALSMLDLGLSPTLSRELARLSALENSAHLMRSTVTTLECINLAIAVGIIGVFYFGAPFIAEYWLNNNSLSNETIRVCLQLMGVQCAFQLLTNYYTNGLIGLQYMVRANSVLALNHTLRALVGLFVLIATSLGVKVYFLSQALLTFVGMLITAYALYTALPADDETSAFAYSSLQKLILRFNLERFKAIRSFAAGVAVITFCAFIVMQTDKIILSKLVTLEQFGYYTVAISIAVTIAGAAAIISRSVLPRMNQLVALNETETLKILYLKSSSFAAWLVLPISGLLIVFNQQFLILYLGNADTVIYIAPIFVILMFGYAVHSLMYIPGALSLAYGWTRYSINVLVVAILVMTPITVLATLNYGVMGAACTWVILSIGYLCFSIIYLHWKIHPDWMWSFYRGISLQLLILVLCCVSLLLKH